MSFELPLTVTEIVQNRPRKEGTFFDEESNKTIPFKNSLFTMFRRSMPVPDDDFGFIVKEVTLEVEFKCSSVDHLKSFFKFMEHFKNSNSPFTIPVLPVNSKRLVCSLPTDEIQQTFMGLMQKK
jgi:hypothetical protein